MFLKTAKPATPIFLLALFAGVLSAQITITSPTTLLPASTAIAYEPFTLTATGGTAPYTWTVIGTGLGTPSGYDAFYRRDNIGYAAINRSVPADDQGNGRRRKQHYRDA